ncbi:hypothetical protein HMPREF9081_2302 [Centipeda periodontii DSM 2778]|jgi:hypothetical protein|uniref:Uncharacterized protein n=1 Tax=Centipeda periodontii DSM 2778 TaxID=888060 RepID=F5RPV5_9FIRM|nr:hypothetical protein [Centipeda periodontii]EGK57465.1 hypothetical protein HMPREF9081_2302 [Centipeda periodontii DSM 2778]
MFKLGMSLVFSVIAALIVFITGIVGDARIATALLRSFAAFVCAGAFTYLVTFVLEAKGWAAFDKLPAERMQDMQTQFYDADDIDFDAVENGTKASEEFAESSNFEPLSEDSFVHMRTPPADVEETGEGSPAPAA